MTQNGGGKMVAVDVRSNGSTFEAGTPRELFDSPYIPLTHSTISPMFHPFVVSSDGQRFLISHPPSNDPASLTMPIVVVENWAAAIGK